jgi:type I restriction enzyme S subunit
MTPYLRAANIKDGHLDLSDVKEMDFDAAERRKFGLINGDVLVSEGSGSADAVGASARWANEVSGPVCFQNTLLRYRAIEDVSIPSFVYHWCRWAHESGAFKETATGTNILHIGSTRAVEMLVHVPSISNQIEACDLLDSLETSTTSLEREIKDAVHLRGQLLARVLTGSTAVLPSYDAHISEVA